MIAYVYARYSSATYHSCVSQISEGKEHLPRGAYLMMCQKARESTKQPWVFAYLTALGEHIARSNNISTLSFLYMRGLGDSPVQTAFGSETTNQEGQQPGWVLSQFFSKFRLAGWHVCVCFSMTYDIEQRDFLRTHYTRLPPLWFARRRW